jgi:putative acetyltransferase
MSRILITPARPDSSEAIALIAELDELLDGLYPAESRHGFSVEKLLTEQVSFFVGYYDQQPAACGGIKLFGRDFGEIKRMYVRPQFRGLGLAKAILQELSNYAQSQGVAVLRLETGIHQTEAIGLYERMGFVAIDPFPPYRPDPLSLFYEKRLS